MCVVQIMVQVFCVSGDTLIPYVLSDLLSLIVYHVQNILSLIRFLNVILKNIIMRVIVYRLVLLAHIREALL